ncbi:hypothetical protein [Oryzibacter oryziterrae]|uniref:hypothetical protein n=1 Tax=Oryzibacter oryziterrae TaxID=2766474 RepID=UPI001F1B7C93|nr:hypothetical protein [Oryzibacter oryziterrae]
MLLKKICCSLGALAAAQFVASVAFAAPFNDKQSGAIDLPSATFSFVGSVDEATPEVEAPLKGRSDMRTVWYRLKNLPVGKYFIDSKTDNKVAIGVWMDPDGSGEWIKIGESKDIPVVGGSGTVLSGLAFSNKAKPVDFYIEVGRAPQAEDTSKSFGINIQALADGNTATALTTPFGRSLAIGAYNDVLPLDSKVLLTSSALYAVNVDSKALSLKVTSDNLSASDATLPTVDGLVKPLNAVRLTLKSKGFGPHYGEVGTFRHSFAVEFADGSVSRGKVNRSLTIMRLGQKQTGKGLVIDIQPSSVAGKLGEKLDVQLTLTNPGTAKSVGCFLGRVGTNVDYDLVNLNQIEGMSYQRLDPVTKEPVGSANAIFELAPGAKKLFHVTGRVRAVSEFGKTIITPYCAEGVGAGDALYTDGLVATYTGNPKGTADAQVSFPKLPAPRLVSVPKNGSKLVQVVVKNTGATRKLTLFGTNGLLVSDPAMANKTSFCEANGSTCKGTPSTTLSLTFPAGGSKTFYVKISNTGGTITDPLKGILNVNVKDGSYIAGSASLQTKSP